jgi:hypothetical protein
MTPDLNTALIVWSNKELLKKVFGPTADYVGEGLKAGVEKGAKNIERIIKVATKRLGEKAEIPGTVSPRVLRDVFMEGAFIEDEFMIEYFGGILASSRTPDGRDDRGAAMLGLVKRLSKYQVRAHYIAYRLIREKSYPHEYGGSVLRIPGRFEMLPDEFSKAMDFDEDENRRREVLVEHIMLGLVREDLLDGTYGGAHPTGSHTPMGVELFLWAHGKGDATVQSFLDPATDFGVPINIPGLD